KTDITDIIVLDTLQLSELTKLTVDKLERPRKRLTTLMFKIVRTDLYF
ncbi:unnamed protein product, partial [Rotaria sordida]